MFDINFPWKLYPIGNYKNMTSEYNHYDIYKKNSLKLYKFINDYKTYNIINYSNLITYICIGNPMDEYFYSTKNNINTQWRQLFPSYLENKKNVLIIIITPDINYINNEPLFINKTLYKWTKKNLNTYYCEEYKILVKIFICPFITKDSNNSLCIQEIKNKHNNNIFTKELKNITQTENDITFIDDFYNKFTSFVNIINTNGLIICNYLAVFNKNSIYNKYNDFYFFPEINKIIDKTMLLLTWSYDINNLENVCFSSLNPLFFNTMKINYSSDTNFYIDYKDKPYFVFVINNDNGYLEKYSIDNINKFTDFNEIKKYKKILCYDIKSCIIIKNKL